MNNNKSIYMDNAATTRIYEEVLMKMHTYLEEEYGNPGGLYELASRAQYAVNSARETVARTLNCENNEIFFTSGGTESDNWAIKGVAELYMNRGNAPHIITTAFEHHAVLNTCLWLKKNGCQVTYIKPDASGCINIDDIIKSIRSNTCLISVMFVNNEIGTVQDIERIGEIAKEHGILFHTDAVQAYGHIPIDVRTMNIDLLSASSHKFNGPKGVGFLYVNNQIKLPAFMHGGAQERNRRAGTENVASICGMAEAARIHDERMKDDCERTLELRDYLVNKLKNLFSHKTSRMYFNGNFERRLAGNVNFTIEGYNAEELVLRLGMKGICISTGAACTSSDDTASHVLAAIGLTTRQSKSALRITLCEKNTEEEIDTLINELDILIR